jgi:hypothetical protein
VGYDGGISRKKALSPKLLWGYVKAKWKIRGA